MNEQSFVVEPLSKQHDRNAFNSGSEPLDRYLREQSRQDMRRRMSACFVAHRENSIVAYYTLASTSLMLSDLPQELARKLPRYPTVPAVRMGRLAVDLNYRSQGLGGAMLADALTRAIKSEIAAFALVVDAKNESAAAFYRHHGFIALPEAPAILFLPLATVHQVKKK